MSVFYQVTYFCMYMHPQNTAQIKLLKPNHLKSLPSLLCNSCGRLQLRNLETSAILALAGNWKTGVFPLTPKRAKNMSMAWRHSAQTSTICFDFTKSSAWLWVHFKTQAMHSLELNSLNPRASEIGRYDACMPIWITQLWIDPNVLNTYNKTFID